MKFESEGKGEKKNGFEEIKNMKKRMSSGKEGFYNKLAEKDDNFFYLESN